MVVRPCLEPGCTTLIPLGTGSRCPRHGPQRWDKGSTRAWRQQRARIIERDGYRCTAIINGQRCQTTHPLEVHHLTSGTTVNLPDQQLTTVCQVHNPRGGA